MNFDLNQLLGWHRRLCSSDEKTRLDCITEIIAFAFTNLDDKELERYVKQDLSVLRDFVLSANLNSEFRGRLSRWEITKVLRINWPVVESLLLNWSSLREEIKKRGKGKILFTNQGAKWFYKQTRDFYVYLKALCYDFYCPKCKLRIAKPHEPIIAKWSPDKSKLLAIYHVQCVIPKKELMEIGVPAKIDTIKGK